MMRAKPRQWSACEYAVLRMLWPVPGILSRDIATCLGRQRGPVERVARERLGLLPRVTIRMKMRRGEIAA